MSRYFQNRVDAGRHLAVELHAYAGRDDVVVLGLPRGGIPVACEVARALGVPLDCLVVRKLGVPGQEELAMGAVASGGVRVLNHHVIATAGVPPSVLAQVVRAKTAEVEARERLFRNDKPPPDVTGRTVILVDDGIATGATIRAAAMALRQLDPARIVIAVPVAAPECADELADVADEFVCLLTPDNFLGVGRWYDDFSQVTDDQVREILQGVNGHPPPVAAAAC